MLSKKSVENHPYICSLRPRKQQRERTRAFFLSLLEPAGGLPRIPFFLQASLENSDREKPRVRHQQLTASVYCSASASPNVPSTRELQSCLLACLLLYSVCCAGIPSSPHFYLTQFTCFHRDLEQRLAYSHTPVLPGGGEEPAHRPIPTETHSCLRAFCSSVFNN